MLSEHSQESLLSQLLHDYLANPKNKTNVHLHHQLPYTSISLEKGAPSPEEAHEISFFNLSPTTAELFRPVNNLVHKPFTISQFLSKKLRWVTLGAQYDWTQKMYPAEEESAFPEPLARFVNFLFPSIRPEAAIVNIYRPGDALSVHRDVSEESDNALISVSLGCQGILVVGVAVGDANEGDAVETIAVRLYSGDAVCLSGPSRFAWHGLPRILPGTCPDNLRDWPAQRTANGARKDQHSNYEAWRGWMSNKRVNLSVRQIQDVDS